MSACCDIMPVSEIHKNSFIVFFRKNLAFPNPYLFKHPKRKRPMRQKDALKKMSDKREADKIV